MYRYNDISALTRMAVIAVSIHLVTSTISLLAGISFDFLVSLSGEEAWDRRLDYLSSAAGVIFIAAVAMTGRWTYRACANAHALAPDLPTSPGWAVGWHFVPGANLFKPFQAMKEIWLASHYSAGWRGRSAPALLGWWWALWIVFFVLGGVGAALPDGSSAFDVLDPAKLLVNIPLCLTLITIMRRVSAAQWHAVHHDIFA